ncbi:MAG: aldose epimerase family protein [Candidatus Arcticimaribacter sp.]
MNPGITKDHFGTLKEQIDVYAYVLKNSNGLEVEVLNYGGIIRRLSLPNRDRQFENCVLGFDDLKDYEEKSPYFGAIVGRFGNRIAHGKFMLDGTEYSLAQNHGTHHLHGGEKGFDKAIWQVQEDITTEGVGLILTHISPHLEEGYPGTLSTQVTYRLTEQNILMVDYIAHTDRPTILNLTQHSYFNLSGNLQQDCLDHHLQIQADHFLAVDQNMIPTGEKTAVHKTPFDFTTVKNIGEAIIKPHKQLSIGKGFDHCYCFDVTQKEFKKVAALYHSQSGRKMEVYTSSPGMQLYTANHLEAPFVTNGAVCLETQGYPDSPNQTHFPSTILRPEESFKSSTHFQFSIDKNN